MALVSLKRFLKRARPQPCQIWDRLGGAPTAEPLHSLNASPLFNARANPFDVGTEFARYMKPGEPLRKPHQKSTLVLSRLKPLKTRERRLNTLDLEERKPANGYCLVFNHQETAQRNDGDGREACGLFLT